MAQETAQRPSMFARQSVLHEPSSDPMRRRIIAKNPLQACLDITEAFGQTSPGMVQTCKEATHLVAEAAVVVAFTGVLNGHSEEFADALNALAETYDERTSLFRYVGNWSLNSLTEKPPL